MFPNMTLFCIKKLFIIVLLEFLQLSHSTFHRCQDMYKSLNWINIKYWQSFQRLTMIFSPFFYHWFYWLLLLLHIFKKNFKLTGLTTQNGRRNWTWNWSLLKMKVYPWQFWLGPMSSCFRCRSILFERNDLEIKTETAKQDIGLHMTFSAFRFAVCTFESLSFLQYCMF